MSQYNWITGDLVTAARLNANGYGLFKGVAGFEDTVILADNVTGTFQIKPTSDPAASTQLIQVQNAAGTTKFAVSADGSVYVNPASASSKIPVKLDEVLIAAGTATNITLTPSGTYTHLRVVGYPRSDSPGPDQIRVQYNGDVAGNYDFLALQTGSGPIWNTQEGLADVSAVVGYAGGIPSALIIDIPYYRGGWDAKTFTSQNSCGANYSHLGPLIVNCSGWWRSLAAITSLKFTLFSSNFVAGTILSLYGIP